MALPDILAKIEVDAAAEADAIRAAGAEKARGILADAEEKARAYDKRERRIAQSKADAAAETIRVEARVAARDSVLEARRETISATFKAAIDAVNALDDAVWVGIFVPRIADAVRSGEEIMLGSEDSTRKKALVAALADVGISATVSKQAAPFAHGVYIAGEKTSVSLSVPELIEDKRRALETQVADILSDDLNPQSASDSTDEGVAG